MSNQFSRAIGILKAIKNEYPYASETTQLFDAVKTVFPCSKRTLQRDLCHLRDEGLIYSTRSTVAIAHPNYWVLTDNGKEFLGVEA